MDKGQVVEEGPPAQIFDAPQTERARELRRQDPAALISGDGTLSLRTADGRSIRTRRG